ncbi:MAG: type II toxin-antitoxin system PrlF family antitoxin [Cyanobacteria bacterium P01_A01_bin.84]
MSEKSNLEAESTLTDRYQTTVPESVRKALRLNKRDKIHYKIEANGQVVMSRADNQKEDPVIGKFLGFLAQDMSKNPQHIQAISSDLLERTQSLVKDVEFDIDAPLSDEDE